MNKVIVVLFSVAGMLVWIYLWIMLLLTGLPNLFRVTWRRHLDLFHLFQRFVLFLQQSINSEQRGPYFFWTVLPFLLIAANGLLWLNWPFTWLAAIPLGLSIGYFIAEEYFTKHELHERILRYSAYLFEGLAFFFCYQALHGTGMFMEKFAANLATEFGSLSITLLFLDELYRWRERTNEAQLNQRLAADRKRNIIQQLGSRSNDFALEAARIVLHERWLTDGSLVEANLVEASLQNANLMWANLQSAYLMRANLQYADMRAANLQSATLLEANLQHAKLHAANLQSANLWDADLQYSDLAGTNLQHATLLKVDLRHANLWGANLQHADLMFARLQNIVLLNADLQHADLRGSRLQQAILSITDLPESHYKQILIRQEDSPQPANFLNAKYESATIWPDGFDPVAAGAILIDEIGA